MCVFEERKRQNELKLSKGKWQNKTLKKKKKKTKANGTI